jgi:hypothetical protein
VSAPALAVSVRWRTLAAVKRQLARLRSVLTYRPGAAIGGKLPQMTKPKSMRSAREILIGCATLAVAANTWAGSGVWMPDSSLGPQMTLYVSQPLWGRGNSGRSYGMRLEQVRSDVGLPRRAEYGTVHRKALIDLQFRPHAGTRLEFAARVSWDLGRDTFGLTPDGTSRVIDLAFRAHELATAQPFQPWAAAISSAARPARFVLRCDAASTDLTSSYVRHRTDELSSACNALAMTAGRRALAF